MGEIKLDRNSLPSKKIHWNYYHQQISCRPMKNWWVRVANSLKKIQTEQSDH